MLESSNPHHYVWAILPEVDEQGIVKLVDKEEEPTKDDDIKLLDPEAEDPEKVAIEREHLCYVLYFGPFTSIDYNEEVGNFVKTETVAWVRVLEDGRILAQDPLVLRGADYVKLNKDK